MKKSKALLSAVIILFAGILTGCIHTHFISMVNDKGRDAFNLAALNSSGIPLYFSSRPEKNYDELFYIMSKGTLKHTTTKELLLEMKTKAQHLGADAVVNITFSSSINMWGADVLIVSGAAIKFK